MKNSNTGTSRAKFASYILQISLRNSTRLLLDTIWLFFLLIYELKSVDHNTSICWDRGQLCAIWRQKQNSRLRWRIWRGRCSATWSSSGSWRKCLRNRSKEREGQSWCRATSTNVLHPRPERRSRPSTDIQIVVKSQIQTCKWLHLLEINIWWRWSDSRQ